MGCMFGVYDLATIEAALGHRGMKSIRNGNNQAAAWDQTAQLKHEWANLVDGFSWRQQPKAVGKTIGIT